MEAMGGLLQRMPRTGMLFIIGATAAAALPGTNAFASEALLYFALVGSAPRGNIATLAAAFIALTGALAVACFVRLTGATFLGAPRTSNAVHAHESPVLMLFPIVVLAVACVALGVMPAIVAQPLESIAGVPGEIAPFFRAIALPIQLAAGGTALVLAALIVTSRRSARRLTWDCGYAEPTARMQYTAGSLAEWFTTRLIPNFLRPRVRVLAPEGLHPTAATFATEIDEPFADRLMQPIAARWAERAMRLRWMQQGRLTLYLLYVFVATVAGVAWAVVFPLLRGGR
jgi:NADH:ubiquinone oxidoreductase subunit 5 (subunit L)/multisubunit Na+/H+ antiporter MnhA subunit